jgi:CheY-like chemotaxis protein
MHSLWKRTYLSVQSEVGLGTTFYIYLPASAGKTMERKLQKKVKPASGSGRILLMDDEESIQNVCKDMLRFLGYEVDLARDGAEVDLARDGAEAIELYKVAMESGRPFDAVVLDLTIPGGLGGKETIKRLIEIDLQLKGIVSSGYSDDQVMANFKEYGFKGSIAKPYKIKEFSEVLHKVIMGKTR